MTTIPELEAKLADLQKQLEVLKQQPQAVEEIPLEEFLPFEPKNGEDYWSVLITAFDGLEIEDDEWVDSTQNKAHFLMGNIFRTERAAKIIMENRITLAELKRLANFVPDWSDFKQEKWIVNFDFEEQCIISERKMVTSGSDVYFKTSEEALTIATDKVGHARIKQLMRYGV